MVLRKLFSCLICCTWDDFRKTAGACCPLTATRAHVRNVKLTRRLRYHASSEGTLRYLVWHDIHTPGHSSTLPVDLYSDRSMCCLLRQDSALCSIIPHSLFGQHLRPTCWDIASRCQYALLDGDTERAGHQPQRKFSPSERATEQDTPRPSRADLHHSNYAAFSSRSYDSPGIPTQL